VARSDEFITGAYKVDNGDSTEYFHGIGQNAVGTASGANVTVYHPKYRMRSWNRDHYGNEADDWDVADWTRSNADEHGNVPLFTETRTPAKFDYAMSTKDASIHAGKLGLHAIADTQRRFGERPWASNNTSRHSTKVVNRAIEDGIIPGVYGQQAGELATQGNDYDWREAHDAIQSTHSGLKSAMARSNSPVEPIDLGVIDSDTIALTKEAAQNRRKKGRVSSLSEGISDSVKPKITSQQLELF